MLHHPDNDHWREWREAVERTGYTESLSRAAMVLLELENLSPSAFHTFCSIRLLAGFENFSLKDFESFTINLYQNL